MNVKKNLLCSVLFLISCRPAFSWIDFNSLSSGKQIITDLKHLEFPDFPGTHNPSLIQNDQGFLLTFRYSPDLNNAPWISYIGLVQFDLSLNPVSTPYLLNTRRENSKTPSQAEDARLFSYRNRLFVIYNDNIEVVHPSYGDRRDMFIAELIWTNDHYELSTPLKLYYEAEYSRQLWQKNWIPFEYEGKLFFSYTINPHLVLYPNLMTGACYSFYDTDFPSQWQFGKLRGSSQAQLMDGEYFAFFHSSICDASEASFNNELWHYFMGAYTFSAKPPFQITSMTPRPLVTEGMYTRSYNKKKKVVFPGGFAVVGPFIYLAYGKDDCEIWIMTIDKEALKKAMKPIDE